MCMKAFELAGTVRIYRSVNLHTGLERGRPVVEMFLLARSNGFRMAASPI
jgi:hypothetical protein